MTRDLAVDRDILQLIIDNKAPSGQGTLHFLLRQLGYTISAPTVGRRLQELEHRGLLRKVSVEGRVITSRGLEVLNQWHADFQWRTSKEALLDALKKGDKAHLLQLLESRRLLERETAALAAAHATNSDLRALKAVLSEQAVVVDAGGLGTEQDVAFHLGIARASRNSVLESLVSILRNQPRYNVLVTSMRKVVGGRLVVEHNAVLQAIQERNPEGAREAMDRHLTNLSNDLRRYWSRWVGDSTGEKSKSGPREITKGSTPASVSKRDRIHAAN